LLIRDPTIDALIRPKPMQVKKSQKTTLIQACVPPREGMQRRRTAPCLGTASQIASERSPQQWKSFAFWRIISRPYYEPRHPKKRHANFNPAWGLFSPSSWGNSGRFTG
jgi:hypothetical protein